MESAELERLSQVAKIASSCVSRWGASFSLEPVDPNFSSSLRSTLILAARKALAFEFVPHYADDHSWSGSMRGLSQRRVAEIAAAPFSVDSDIYGVVATAIHGDQMIVIPLATDLDMASSEAARELFQADIMSHIDNASISRIFETDTFEVAVSAANWKTLGLLMEASLIPLDEALFLRSTAAWDFVRGSVSGLPCPPLPEFSEKDFSARYFRSLRFSRVEFETNHSMLSMLVEQDPQFGGQRWWKWFESIVGCLNAIGTPSPFEGLSVILCMVYEESDVEDLMVFHPVSHHNICVACGLNPVAASYLHDVVRVEPLLYHSFNYHGEAQRYRAIGVKVIADVELAAYGVTTEGRRVESYKRLVAATREAE